MFCDFANWEPSKCFFFECLIQYFIQKIISCAGWLNRKQLILMPFWMEWLQYSEYLFKYCYLRKKKLFSELHMEWYGRVGLFYQLKNYRSWPRQSCIQWQCVKRDRCVKQNKEAALAKNKPKKFEEYTTFTEN